MKGFNKFGFTRVDRATRSLLVEVPRRVHRCGDERACSQVVLDAESLAGTQLAMSVRGTDTFRITARAGPIDADFRHAAIIENFRSEIDQP